MCRVDNDDKKVRAALIPPRRAFGVAHLLNKFGEQGMSKIDDQDIRISAIFGREIPEVKEKTLEVYRAHLKQHLELPCQLTGIEDFDWEEYYVFGPGDEREYERLKKTKPSYRDTFDLISFDEMDERVGIIANVRRVSDHKKFTLPLADLEAVNKKSRNYQLLDDYSVWFVNNQ